MKRIVAALIPFALVATAALAADNPVSCQGASCKVTVNTRTSGNVNTVAASFLGNGNVGIGTTSPQALSFAHATGILDVNEPTLGGKLTLHRSSGGALEEFAFLKANNGTYVDSTGAATASNNKISFRVSNTNSDNSTLINGLVIASTGAVAAKGTTTNDSAASGIVGEYLENVRSTSTPNFTSGTVGSIDSGNTTFNDTNETGITLTAGDWDVSATAVFIGSTTTISGFQVGIGTAKGNDSAGYNDTNSIYWDGIAATSRVAASLPVIRKSISSTTTYYLKGFVTFTGGSVAARGHISARRVR